MNGQSCFVPRMSARAGGWRSAACCALAAPAAMAVSFETDSVKGSFDSTISFGMQWRDAGDELRHHRQRQRRLRRRRRGTLGEPVNGPGQGATSNPDFNYLQPRRRQPQLQRGDSRLGRAQGQRTSSRCSSTDGWRALARGTWVYDFGADDTGARRCPTTPRTSRSRNITLLDAWVSKDFDALRPARQGARRQPGASAGARTSSSTAASTSSTPIDLRKLAQAGHAAQGDLPAGADGCRSTSARPTT